MKKILLLAGASLLVGSAFASPNFVQDPNTGDNAWGPIGSLSFEDDLIIDSGTWNVNSITLYEFFGDGDTYTMNILSNYSDNGGSILHTYSVPNSGGTFNGDGQFAVTFNTAGLTLAPGTYIINFQATSAAFGGDYYWYNANVGSVVGNEAHLAGTGGSSTWASESFDMAWNINASQAVPEPASMAALGIGALALIRRRKAAK